MSDAFSRLFFNHCVDRIRYDADSRMVFSLMQKHSYIVDIICSVSPFYRFEFLAILIEICFLAFFTSVFCDLLVFFRLKLNPFFAICVNILSSLLASWMCSINKFPFVNIFLVTYLLYTVRHRACYILKLLLQLWHHCDIFHASICCVISHPLAAGF